MGDDNKELSIKTELDGCLNPFDEKDTYNRYKFPEVKIPAGGFIKLDMRSHLIRSLRHTREVYSTIMMTRDMKVTAVDNTGCNLVIKCDALSLNKCRKMQTIQNTNEHLWVIDRPLLPYQGVMLVWHDFNCGSDPYVQTQDGVDTGQTCTTPKT
jgi:hypothetical protein